jgi:death-on-curing protein
MKGPNDCFHLTIEIVKDIHAAALHDFGGLDGVRDENLLLSAILTPQSSFGGASPYADLSEVAAAYLFYLCRNNPFLDGNKRTALGAAIVFLRLNGIEPSPDSDAWHALTLGIASGETDRAEATRQLRPLLPKN